MQLKFFWIPARECSSVEAEVNAFLSTHRVVHLEKEFLSDSLAPGWSICVQWITDSATSSGPKTSKIDYRDELDAESFRIFALLRTWRKERAAKDGIPVYTIATNEQLAEIARKRLKSKAALSQLAGFGPARLEKYGDDLAEQCRRPEAPRAWCAAAPGTTRRRTAAPPTATGTIQATAGTTWACAWPQLTCPAAAGWLTRSSECLPDFWEADPELPRAGRDTGWCQPNVRGGSPFS